MKQTKRSILMVNLPFSGHTNPTLGLAKSFIELGCSVTYIHSPDWKKQVESTGAKFIPYDNYPSNLTPIQKEIKSWSAAYQTVKRIGSAFDCLVYEALFVQGKALADSISIPSFRLFSTFSLNNNVLKDFGKNGGWYLTSIFRFPIICDFFSYLMKKKFDLKYDNICQEIEANSPSLNFTYTIKDFQIFSEEFPESRYKYVGPAINYRNEINFDFSNFKQPIIYISLGTLLNTSVKFFKKCIKAFRNQPFSVIMSIGDSVKKEKLGDIPDNIFVYSFVPQLQILEKATLFITHGGMNSVNEAIYYGTPMIVIPVGNDQPTVANQIENVGIGIKLKKNTISPELLRKKANQVINDYNSKLQLEKFQSISQNAGGNIRIAELILREMYSNK